MRIRVWYRRGVGLGLEKAHDKGNIVMVLIMQMISLSKDAARKIYDQMRLIWMASPPR
jgi:hypothetical protein